MSWRKDLIRPPALAAGGTVAVVSPSWGGPGAVPHRYAVGKRVLEEAFGVRVVEMPHTLADPAYVAAHPEARAEDLMEAWSNPEIDAIVASIGGDDSVRVLRHLDLEVIRKNAKPLCGYSDTTTLTITSLLAGVVAFNGPSVLSGFAENVEPFPYMLDAFRAAVCTPEPIGILQENTTGWTDEMLVWEVVENQKIRRSLNPATGWRYHGNGRTSGHLIGGCIEALEFIKATPWWPGPEFWDGAILFVETSEERPTPGQVKWWMRNYATSGILHGLNGILVGRPQGAGDEDLAASYDGAVLDVVRSEEGLDIPVVTGMDFGHTDPQLTLPLGVQATIDCDAGTVSVDEPAVS